MKRTLRYWVAHVWLWLYKHHVVPFKAIFVLPGKAMIYILMGGTDIVAYNLRKAMRSLRPK